MKESIAIADYETYKIGERPNESPPKPVGCALKIPGGKSKYYAWGHPCENNCTFSEFKRIMKQTVKKYKTVYHNAKFDIEVSEKWLDIPLPNPDMYECTMLLAYLRNPRERDLKLKNLADRWLNLPPDEQTELKNWIIKNIKGAKESNWGEFIAFAPGDLVGKYAIGDIDRTELLYYEFHPYIVEHGMSEAYLTEKIVLPITLEMERKGVPIDVKRLNQDLKAAYKLRDKSIDAVKKKLGVKEFNPGAPTQVIPLFEKAGLVHPDDWITTEKGNIRIGIEHLSQVCNDKNIIKHMEMHSKLTKVISTYMEPWLKSAKDHGVFYPWFNQTRGDNDHGTKSGRFSSNFQQTPREPDERLVGLPWMRNYVTGDSSKHIVLRRDFCQQEVRILAYYEDGELYNAYLKNPHLDVHDLVGMLIKERSGLDLSRIIVKTCNFLIIYGGGAPALQEQLGLSLSECKTILKAHAKALPGAKELANDIMKQCKRGEPIYTAGGREYYAERGYEWRMTNMLIQAGAADHAKRSMIRIHEAFKKLEDTRIMITVHDEFIVSTPYTSKKDKAMVMTTFRDAMNNDDLFNPIAMISDGKWGNTWGGSVKCPI